MNYKAVPRKKRTHPAIERDEKAFGEVLRAGDTEKAAKIVLGTVFEMFGVDFFKNVLDRANNMWKRAKLRQGL